MNLKTEFRRGWCRMLKGMRFLLLGEMIHMRHKTDTYAKVNISMKTLNFVYITLRKKEKAFKMSRGQTNNCLQNTQQHRLVVAVQLCASHRASNMQHRFCPCYPRSVLQLVWQAIAFLGRTWLVAKVCRSVTLFPPTRRPVRPVAEFKNFAVRGTASLPSSPPPPPPPHLPPQQLPSTPQPIPLSLQPLEHWFSCLRCLLFLLGDLLLQF